MIENINNQGTETSFTTSLSPYKFFMLALKFYNNILATTVFDYTYLNSNLGANYNVIANSKDGNTVYYAAGYMQGGGTISSFSLKIGANSSGYGTNSIRLSLLGIRK